MVTSLGPEQMAARALYEEVYCARGDMENRIKEQQLALFAERTSAQTLRANQLCLYFASFAYTLLEALRHWGLAGTQLARAQCDTIRLKLLKIGVRIRGGTWRTAYEPYACRSMRASPTRAFSGRCWPASRACLCAVSRARSRDLVAPLAGVARITVSLARVARQNERNQPWIWRS